MHVLIDLEAVPDLMSIKDESHFSSCFLSDYYFYKIPGSLIIPRDVGALQLNRRTLHGLRHCERGEYFLCDSLVRSYNYENGGQMQTTNSDAMPAVFSQCAGCHNFMVSVTVSANKLGYEQRS